VMPKEDFLPGQTKELDPNAADTEALTNFYQSLLRQRPESEMAQRWLLQYGLLPGGEDEAKAMIKKLGKSAPSSKPTAAKKPSKPAANDDDFESKPKSKAPAKKPPPSKSKATIAKEDSSDEEFEEKKKPAATKKPAASSKPPAKRPGTACRFPSRHASARGDKLAGRPCSPCPRRLCLTCAVLALPASPRSRRKFVR